MLTGSAFVKGQQFAGTLKHKDRLLIAGIKRVVDGLKLPQGGG